MFTRFKKTHKWKQLIDIGTVEVRLSVAISLCITLLAVFLNVFDDLLNYKQSLQSLLLCFIGGFIALTGFVLAGIAIITSLFSKDQVNIINKDNPDSLTEILVSFEFLAFLSTMAVIFMSIMYIGLDVPLCIITNIFFYILCYLTVYFLIYILMYTVGLCGNCIRLFNISITAERIIALEKEIQELKQEMKDKDSK